MHAGNIAFIIILLLATTCVYATRKLTLAGTVTGGLVATALYLGFQFAGVTLLATFFGLATLGTSFQKHAKLATGTSGHPEMRDAFQVLANGGLAAFFALIALYRPLDADRYAILVAAALASATADTLSSELGTVFGKRFYNIISFKPDTKGQNGVVSLEGTLIGLAGSAAIAGVFAIYYSWEWSTFYILVAGTAGNLFDSILGASLERRGFLTNNLVNFSNTVFAALVAFLLLLI